MPIEKKIKLNKIKIIFLFIFLFISFSVSADELYSCKAFKFIEVSEDRNRNILEDGDFNFEFRIDKNNLKIILSGGLMFLPNPIYSIYYWGDTSLMAQGPTKHSYIHYDFKEKKLLYSSNDLSFADVMFARCNLV